MTLAERAVSPNGFSEFAMYTESRVLVAKREAEEGAAKGLQAGWRAAVARTHTQARAGRAGRATASRGSCAR